MVRFIQETPRDETAEETPDGIGFRKKRSEIRHIVIFVFFIINVSLGLSFPVFPLRPEEILGGTSDSSLWYGVSVFANGLSGMIASPVLGNLSDHLGRRWLLVACCCGLGVELLICGLVDDMSIFIIARAFGGIFSGLWAVATAIVLDVCEPGLKSVHLGQLYGLPIGVGFVLGPIFGGLVGDQYPRGPFVIGGALALGMGVYVHFVLPETAPKVVGNKYVPTNAPVPSTPTGDHAGETEALLSNGSRTSSQRRMRVNDVGLSHLCSSWAAVAMLGETYQIAVLALASLFAALAFQGFINTVVLYLEYKFAFSKLELGLHLGFAGISYALSQVFLINPLTHIMGDLNVAMLSGAWVLVWCAIYSLAQAEVVFWAAFLLGPSGLGFTIMMSMMSNLIPAERQGSLTGNMAVIDRIGRMFGVLGMSALFSDLTDESQAKPLPEVIPLMTALLSSMTLIVLILYSATLYTAPPMTRVSEKIS